MRAQWHLLRAGLRMRRAATGALVHDWKAPEHASDSPSGDVARAREVGTAVRRVAMYGLTRPSCLTRSLAISDFLRSEGFQGTRIRVGVRPGQESVEAHAWVEFAGEVIGDTREHVSRFVELGSTLAK